MKLIWLFCCLYMFVIVNNNENHLKDASGKSLGNTDTVELPKVIVIGEDENAYEKITVQHSKLLLAVCNNDVDLAFKYWIGMMKDIQVYADKSKFDIKGVKMWLNVFYNADGSIKHMAYYLKPNSRNINEKEMKGFLISFMNQYTFGVKDKNAFSHYGSVSFPLLPENITN
ncbi:MAG TPA: hypothetical protein VK590_01270 [Saprospiraceae bacterium]|nr:hypothetical protein [Saprospiraceae bacterium]